MRLINTKTLQLQEFAPVDVPPYAILSHRWGDEEVSFQDMQSGKDLEAKSGYVKVKQTCLTALAHGFDYAWVDTCCIDKTSSTELSEAINSMYRWYETACVCYVYLVDVEVDAVDPESEDQSSQFCRSSWFTRGWTLQELVAPEILFFYNKDWHKLGSKLSLLSLVSRITRIPDTVLRGGSLDSFSIAQRMSWAAGRQTTRLEDQAYCLMGIFNVHMPLLYGEGLRAFTRLQEEIMKVSDDHTIFAWNTAQDQPDCDMFARHPSWFRDSGDIIPLDLPISSAGFSASITLDNKGIHLELQFDNSPRLPDGCRLALLPCTLASDGRSEIGVWLRRILPGQKYYQRYRTDRLCFLDTPFDDSIPRESICVRRDRARRPPLRPILGAIHVGHRKAVEFLLENGASHEVTDNFHRAPLALAAENGDVELVAFLLDRGIGHDQGSLLATMISKQEGMMEMVKLLLDRGIPVEDRGPFGYTPLTLAAKEGMLEVVEMLVDRGASLAPTQAFRWTPLEAAVVGGHVPVVKFLLAKGANPHGEGGAGNSARGPLDAAVDEGHAEVVELLLAHGADPEPRGPSLHLVHAALRRDVDVMKVLIKHGAKMETQDALGRTAAGVIDSLPGEVATDIWDRLRGQVVFSSLTGREITG